MNGQKIAEELAKRRGTKPTAGTIYPALKGLRKKGLVEMEKKGKRTVYRLSEAGREGLDDACQYFCNAFGEIFQEYNIKQPSNIEK